MGPRLPSRGSPQTFQDAEDRKGGAKGLQRGRAGAKMRTSSGAVCRGLSGIWLGLRLEGVAREGAAAATAQMEEEVGSWRQGSMGPGTGEHVLHREAWHWGGPTTLSRALVFRLPAPIIHKGRGGYGIRV